MRESFNPASVPYSPILDSRYPYADWAEHTFFSAELDDFKNLKSARQIASGGLGLSYEGIVDLDYNPRTGTIYALTWWKLYRLSYNLAGALPVAKIKAMPDVGSLPLAVTLDASESFDPSGSPIIGYRWTGDTGTTIVTTSPLFQYTFTENRNTTVSVRVITADFRIANDTTTIYAGNLPPQVAIDWPRPSTSYPDDGTPALIQYSGFAHDPDGIAPPTVWWRVALRHNQHRHELAETFAMAGQHTVLHEEGNTFYLFELFARDERGYTSSDSQVIYRESEAPPSQVEGEWQLYE